MALPKAGDPFGVHARFRRLHLDARWWRRSGGARRLIQVLGAPCADQAVDIRVPFLVPALPRGFVASPTVGRHVVAHAALDDDEDRAVEIERLGRPYVEHERYARFPRRTVAAAHDRVGEDAGEV